VYMRVRLGYEGVCICVYMCVRLGYEGVCICVCMCERLGYEGVSICVYGLCRAYVSMRKMLDGRFGEFHD
jgi:hypothetical protein